MSSVEHVDVLVVGAGISGIGVAWHLNKQHPQRSLALLDRVMRFRHVRPRT